MIRSFCRRLILALAALPIAAAAPAAIRETVLDDGGRAVPVRIVTPDRAPRGGCPILLFSHGAMSNPAKYDRLTTLWAARGYAVLAPTHADSPEHPGGGKVEQARSLPLRMADMRLVLRQAGDLARSGGCTPDLTRVAATGHSYGGLVAQLMGGAVAVGQPVTREPRVQAVVAFSPPGPLPQLIQPEGWAKVAVPMFVQTGTADSLQMVAPQWEAHRASYDAAPGRAWLFVGTGVDHYFSNIICRPERPAPSADVVRAFAAAAALSGDFLDAQLRGDKKAAARLAPRTVAARYPATVLAQYEAK